MKLQIVSDLHLEFNESARIKNAGADILCLAGDICLAQDLYRHPASSIGTNNAENGKKADYYRRFFDQDFIIFYNRIDCFITISYK